MTGVSVSDARQEKLQNHLIKPEMTLGPTPQRRRQQNCIAQRAFRRRRAEKQRHETQSDSDAHIKSMPETITGLRQENLSLRARLIDTESQLSRMSILMSEMTKNIVHTLNLSNRPPNSQKVCSDRPALRTDYEEPELTGLLTQEPRQAWTRQTAVGAQTSPSIFIVDHGSNCGSISNDDNYRNGEGDDDNGRLHDAALFSYDTPVTSIMQTPHIYSYDYQMGLEAWSRAMRGFETSSSHDQALSI